MWKTGHLSGGNASYVEQLYDQFLQDPGSVPQEWRTYFENLPQISDSQESDISHLEIQKYFKETKDDSKDFIDLMRETTTNRNKESSIWIRILLHICATRTKQWK